jgi:uncharacterized protein YbaR (Trm112 family)
VNLDLKKVLACPSCRSALVELGCKGCNVSYSEVGGRALLS